jgi:hypothetical protein
MGNAGKPQELSLKGNTQCTIIVPLLGRSEARSIRKVFCASSASLYIFDIFMQCLALIYLFIILFVTFFLRCRRSVWLCHWLNI